MSTLSEPHIILEMLAENEEAVGALYRTYAEKFPQHHDFWTRLADEEAYHSRLIQKMWKGGNDHVVITENRFDISLLQISLEYLQEKLKQAKNEPFSYEDALSIALEIETGMLERDFFTVYEGTSAQFIRTMEILASATAKHTNVIRDELARKRWTFF